MKLYVLWYGCPRERYTLRYQDLGIRYSHWNTQKQTNISHNTEKEKFTYIVVKDTHTHRCTNGYRQPWQTVAEGLGGKQCYWCCCGKSGNFIGCVPQSPWRHRNVRSKIHLCPPAWVRMWHTRYKSTALCVWKELPVERHSDHSSEMWKCLDVKSDHHFINFFLIFSAGILVLTLILERFKHNSRVCNRQTADRTHNHVTATTFTRDLPQNNADLATLLK